MPGSAALMRTALWGLTLLASMAGWGRLIERLAFLQPAGVTRVEPEAGADLGLRLAWGTAGLLAAGGVLCVLALATAPVLLALVLGGAFLGVFPGFSRTVRETPRPGVPSVRWAGGVVLALVALSSLVAIQYFAAATGNGLNLLDDHLAYLVFPEKILGSGSLIEPFSLRRMSALGGQSFLQALTLLQAASPVQLQLFDLGLCPVIVLALILGAADQRTPRELLVLPVLFLMMLPNLRMNSASEMSGVVFFLALFRTATWPGLGARPISAP